MRFLVFLLVALLLSCNSSRKKQLFADLAPKEDVVIYLSKYDLDSVPAEIGILKKAKRLEIAKDSIAGWVIYPPLSAIPQRIKTPPFRHLPDEITKLKRLEYLALIDLDISELPDNFSQLQNLDSLNLFMNKLTISRELEKLNKLKNLKYPGLTGNKVDTTDIQELKRTFPDLEIDN